MKLTTQQNAIVQSIIESTTNDPRSRIHVLRGYAGTGKTVTLTNIIEQAQNKQLTTLVLTPTAAAKAVVNRKLHDIGMPLASMPSLATCASVVQVPVKTLNMTKNGSPSFAINQQGLTDLYKLVSNFNIDTRDLVSTFNTKTRVTHHWSLKDIHDGDKKATKDINSSDTSVFVEVDTLQKRINESVPNGRQLFQCNDEDDSVLVEPRECASRMRNKVGHHSKDIDLIIVDEVSMVTNDATNVLIDALDYLPNCQLILCGDSGQLPPVNDNFNKYAQLSQGEHTIDDNIVHVHELSDILRSSNDVAHFASIVRTQKNALDQDDKYKCIIHEPTTSLVDVIHKHEHEFTQADAVVTLSNKNVNTLNNHLRSLHGKSGSLERGDKLVCSSNVYGRFTQSFYNGELLTIVSVAGDGHDHDLDYAMNELSRSLSVSPKGSTLRDVKRLVDSEQLIGVRVATDGLDDRYCLIWDTSVIESYYSRKKIMKIMNSLDTSPFPIVDVKLAYALTVHKAQGSEWDNVIYVVSKRDRAIHTTSNLHYTAVTRAKSTITVYTYDAE